LYEFVDLVPDWDELSKGLKAVVLAAGEDGCLGWCDIGVVAICAWDRPVAWSDAYREFVDEHEAILTKLGVEWYDDWDGNLFVDFDERTAKAFQLIHVFIHELGHHHDRITTRSRRRPARGESYAEEYAKRHEDEIIRNYWQYLDRR